TSGSSEGPGRSAAALEAAREAGGRRESGRSPGAAGVGMASRPRAVDAPPPPDDDEAPDLTAAVRLPHERGVQFVGGPEGNGVDWAVALALLFEAGRRATAKPPDPEAA